MILKFVWTLSIPVAERFLPKRFYGSGLARKEEVVMNLIGKCILVVLTAGLFLVVGPGTTTAEIYKWVDSQGNVHFQDRPPQNAGNAAAVEVRQSSPVQPRDLAPGPATATSRGAAAEPVVVPMSAIQVELYVIAGCPWCKKAREYFVAQGVSLTEYDIKKDQAAAARRKELDPRPGVPFAIVNGVKINGYSLDAYAKALRPAASAGPTR